MDHLEVLFRFAPHLFDGAKATSLYTMIRCPFHGEKTPSLSISATKPCFICFGCKVSGHVSALLRQTGLSHEMIRSLMPAPSRKEIDERKFAASIAGKILAGENPFVGRYVLEEEILDHYRLMPTALRRAGFAVETLRHFEVGYDSSYLRITYPLRNVFGDLVGISGRSLIEGDNRYKIYSKRELKLRDGTALPDEYNIEEVKSAILWHGHLVRPYFLGSTNPDDTLVVTEGFKACMWAWQAGYRDSVALVGSYLTPAHAELIARAIPRVVLFLDNNEAGIRGTHSAARKLIAKGVEVLVADYPDEREQPDDLKAEEVAYAVEGAVPYLTWLRSHPEQETQKQTLLRYRERAYV